jgi:phosphonate degradation associated HDIG domain protein
MATSTTDTAKTIDRILELFQERGGALYGGEAVSQLEHALQAAMAAEKEGASPAMISAALLHDLGHLLHNLPEDSAEHGVDDRHEDLACRWLERHFGPEVTEPIRLHVAAKRYLCATDTNYHSALSDASRLSLEIQGGPFSSEETSAFRENPHFHAAVRLRVWDDIAKVPSLKTPDLVHFRKSLEMAAGLSK